LFREYIVTSSKDNTCRVWNVNEKLCCGIGEGHIDSVGAICMSKFIATYRSKQVFMISGGSDKILKRWDLPLHNMKTSKVTKLTPSHSVRAHEKGNNIEICITFTSYNINYRR
jgi:WD40 repeat protein